MAMADATLKTDPFFGRAALFCGGTAVLFVIALTVLSDTVPRGGRIASYSVGIGVLIGVIFTLRSYPYRVLGTFPWLGLVAVAATAPWAIFGFVVWWLWAFFLVATVIGFFSFVVYWLSIRRAAETPWNPLRTDPPPVALVGMMLLILFAAVLAMDGILLSIARPLASSDRIYVWFAFAVASVFAILAWLFLARAAIEWFFVISFGTMYKIRGVGPGLTHCPRVGPLIVIANHGGYFDPIILEWVIPRPLTGLMTSLHYDKRFVVPIARYIFRVIRVPNATVRHEAPELVEAVAALDRGEALMIFPEGWLRRREDVPLKRFGQGVWQILKERPNTPVIACWIEGTWGSYFSHQNGPPMSGKPFDFRRPVTVGASEPVIVPPEILADPWQTRFHLMNEVSEARRHLGLTPLPRFVKTETDAEGV
jgi:1-acyl-sn-glycerol-3-phosphate acyltransferase